MVLFGHGPADPSVPFHDDIDAGAAGRSERNREFSCSRTWLASWRTGGHLMHRFVGSVLVFPAAALVIAACGSSHSNSSSEQPLSDASPGDSSRDAGGRAPSLVPDGSSLDTGVAAHDAAVLDAAAVDAPAPMEAGPMDARASDAVAADAPAPVPDAAADTSTRPLDDPQIVGILEGANTGQILESLLATGNPDDGVDLGLDAAAPAFDAGMARSSNPQVIGYANMIDIDQAQSNSMLDSLGIAPTPSDTQSRVRNDAQGSMARLAPLSGQAFDMAYALDQVATNTRLRDMVNGQLLPVVQDANLKMYLSGTLLPVLDVHILAAGALMGQIADGGAPVAVEITGPVLGE
jgi:predicted outer membrane protein